MFKGRVLFTIFAIQFLAVTSVLGYRAWLNSDAGCVRCHSDRARMEALGYPELYTTHAMVARESGHANLSCLDCHLGNGRAKDLNKAHKGILKALLLDDNGNVLKRAGLVNGAIIPRGNDRIRELLPMLPSGDQVRNVLWQDHNPGTFDFDPDIARKTCARSSCHPTELKQFLHTDMGANFRQRTMKTWLTPYGPHNCGPSFADMPPTGPLSRKSGFDFKNTSRISAECTLGLTKQQAMDKQKFCNICHPGCLDCHYKPDANKGVHHFVTRPTAESCSGNGRGTSICHPGAMDSRRGEAYIGGDYSIPTGMKPDVHYTIGLKCIDCHLPGPKGMGDMTRKATCQDCHIEAEDALARSVHKSLTCAACHISELRGYQLTIWGPGMVAGRPNPFNKYSLYYGIQKPPILMRDQKGRWMPVKVWPHSVGNFSKDVPPSGKILFRWPHGETHDAYYIVGTVYGPVAQRNLLWLEIEQASHPYGKARSCQSCHAGKNGTQTSYSNWEFEEDQGTDVPFKGSHKIVADSAGIRIEDLKNTTPIVVEKGWKLGDFASWLYFRNKWSAPGDFAIRTDKPEYQKQLRASRLAEARLKILEGKLKPGDRKAAIEFRRTAETAIHNPAAWK